MKRRNSFSCSFLSGRHENAELCMFSLVVRAEAFGNDIVQLPDFIPSRDRLVAIYAFQFRAQKRKISFSSVRALKTL